MKYMLAKPNWLRILDAVEGTKTISQIYFKTKLGPGCVAETLHAMKKIGWLNSRTYKTKGTTFYYTEKGRQVLEHLGKAYEVIQND